MSLNARERFRICEQAALQMMRLEGASSREARAQHLAWLRLSAHHVHESLFVQAVSRQLEGMDPQRTIDVDALPTLPEISGTSFEPLSDRIPSPARTRRSWVVALAAAAALMALAWTFFGRAWNETHSYVTAIGEQRSIKLDDGSVMVLNTDSRVRVRLSSTRREIRLVDGEALFIVQSDPSRPFRVSTDIGTVVAVGTQFNVYQRGDSTRVSVIEGAVRIEAAPSHEVVAHSQLNAGDEAIMSPGRVVRSQKPDIQRAVAWRARQLVFRDRSLSEVAAEFNRYNKMRITVANEALGARSISGVFDADDTRPLIDFLESDPELKVTAGESEILIERR